MRWCMRTTVNLPDELFSEAKRAAVAANRTVTSLFEEALRERLSRRSRTAHCETVRLTTHGSGGVMPGVDLDDTAALLDLMESPRDSA